MIATQAGAVARLMTGHIDRAESGQRGPTERNAAHCCDRPALAEMKLYPARPAKR